MGYTHYWRISSATDWQKTWPLDARLIIEAADVPLTKYGTKSGREGEPEISDQAIYLNGDYKSHESFILEPETTKFSFCKTARKQYDIVVSSILLRASQLAGTAISVSSDGTWDRDWKPAQRLVKELWPEEEIRRPWGEEDE
ncbi:unnamed protein product [Zymoseptoria tritici ST99CH_1E4]|uniref:Uncharacterized protein n=1 Tax=Zymoseptoria tritici ST99CH_1E4 TaxID=1276532 RepID=A0A2H1GYH8_ZYMTR|nr:unnamed protein product [Zymoseptoria tritici ST99CH_1E4]